MAIQGVARRNHGVADKVSRALFCSEIWVLRVNRKIEKSNTRHIAIIISSFSCDRLLLEHILLYASRMLGSCAGLVNAAWAIPHTQFLGADDHR